MLNKLRIKIPKFVNNRPGPKWVDLFLQRHPNISLRTPQALTSSRANVGVGDIKEWFRVQKEYLMEKGLLSILDEPERVIF